jgi:hypothetical protein
MGILPFSWAAAVESRGGFFHTAASAGSARRSEPMATNLAGEADLATKPAAGWKPWSRADMARRLADDVPEGWCVNLGIGMPTLVADYIPLEREVIVHSENGVLGMGPAPAPDNVDPWLINAGKQHVTLRPGGSYSHHADSFAMIRGGHIDLCVLGGFQVAENGDIANWATSENDTAPAVGGAMDLAGRRQAAVGADGAPDQERRIEARAPLFLSAHRAGRGGSRLHQPRCARRHRRRLRRAQHRARAVARRLAGAHGRGVAERVTAPRSAFSTRRIASSCDGRTCSGRSTRIIVR